MIYKCEKCGSESNDPVSGEWCVTCDQFRTKTYPEKREYTQDQIFESYLNNKCPVCDSKVDSEDQNGHTEYGGKCIAKYFHCNQCNSDYIVGFYRSRMPIKSEITFNALYKD